MKRVINGKMYNTETAELIHESDNGIYGNDFRQCEESLYKTKNGAYFIAGSGGPMSKYAESSGNTTSGGHGIEVLTEPEALAWLEQNDGTEAIEEYFPDKITEG